MADQRRRPAPRRSADARRGQRQRRFAPPIRAQSTWLSANAGSGKTRVLTDRVARLLLRGVEPQRILCLTYTKAAASEMQNRLFSAAGRMGDEARRRSARGAARPWGEGGICRRSAWPAPASFSPARSRRRAACGSRPSTAFCAALLRRFPLEARRLAAVSPNWTTARPSCCAAEIVEELADGLAPGCGRCAGAQVQQARISAACWSIRWPGIARRVCPATRPGRQRCGCSACRRVWRRGASLAEVLFGGRGGPV